MRFFPTAAMLLAAATAVSATAQAPVPPQRQLSALLRQDASLRAQIGRIQLDALVSRVDAAVARKPRANTQPGKDGSLQHDLDLYTF